MEYKVHNEKDEDCGCQQTQYKDILTMTENNKDYKPNIKTEFNKNTAENCEYYQKNAKL